ncbi:hypothetical protein E5A78_07055 [Helicobacter pylori]|nr:hypothetical protein E5A78_07055 [Helicobacter pylori]
MFFKIYQKLLGTSCLALCLVGCGSDSSEPLVEVEKNSFNSTIKIISKTDNIEIQDLKLNRGNCTVNFVPVGEALQMGVLSQVTPISIQDFKDMASVYKTFEDDQRERLANIANKISQLEQKGVMMEPQVLKFGEKREGISQGCDIIEAEIQTDKGSWTFNFDR